MQIQAKPQNSQLQSNHSTKLRLGNVLKMEDEGVDKLMKKPSDVGKITYPLDNLGNTCFYNSVMQCLIHTVPLLNFCLSKLHQNFCEKRKNEICFMCRFCILINGVVEKNSANPREVLNYLTFLWKTYRRGRQEDAHEFLIILIESFLNSSFKMRQPTRSRLNQEESETPIYKIFGGKTRSQVHCQGCQFKSNRLEDSLAISLDFPNQQQYSKKLTLESCFRSFIQAETLAGQNKYLCSNCNKRCIAKKRFTIHQTPRILIIHLKRFNNMGKKLQQFVEYPKTLDLHQFTSEYVDGMQSSDQKSTFTQKNNPSFSQNQSFSDEKQSQKDIYDLYGLVHHIGSTPRMGHYISYVKTLDGSWFKCNDEQVTKVPQGVQGVLNLQPYILFYQKRNTEQKREVKSIEKIIQQQQDIGLKQKLPVLIQNVSDQSTLDSLIMSSDEDKKAAILQQQQAQNQKAIKEFQFSKNISEMNQDSLSKQTKSQQDLKYQQQTQCADNSITVKSHQKKEESTIISQPNKPNSKILQDLLNKVLNIQQENNTTTKINDLEKSKSTNERQKDISVDRIKQQEIKLEEQNVKDIKDQARSKSQKNSKESTIMQPLTNDKINEILTTQKVDKKVRKDQELKPLPQQDTNASTIQKTKIQTLSKQQDKKPIFITSMKDLHPKVINRQTKKRKRDTVQALQSIACNRVEEPFEQQSVKRLKKQ